MLVGGCVAVMEGLVVWLVGPPYCPRIPLSLTLSHGGERGFCPALPQWLDVRPAEAPASAGMAGVLAMVSGTGRKGVLC